MVAVTGVEGTVFIIILKLKVVIVFRHPYKTQKLSTLFENVVLSFNTVKISHRYQLDVFMLIE